MEHGFAAKALSAHPTDINFIGDNDGRMPFKFRRLQFPVAPAFAMTINKAQDQTLAVLGLILPSPVFSHGQLYVGRGLLCGSSREGTKVLSIMEGVQVDRGRVANVVWPEVL